MFPCIGLQTFSALQSQTPYFDSAIIVLPVSFVAHVMKAACHVLLTVCNIGVLYFKPPI